MSTVSAVIRRDGAVLLVRQQGPEDHEAAWYLPGGVVEPGEDLKSALQREVREETGLAITDAIGIAWVCAITWRTLDEFGEGFSFVFEVDDSGGEPVAADPDGIVQEAAFVELAEALKLLQAVPWPRMRDPAIAYLEGRVGRGAVFSYELGTDGAPDVRVTTVGVNSGSGG